jgi:hypothetical protein
MTDLLEVGFSSWIIGDGNYGDFVAGEAYAFALEYYNEQPFEACGGSTRDRTSLGGANYRVEGDVTFHDDEMVVIDTGMLAYRELHSGPKPPRHFAGALRLGVDPFLYFERLARRPDVPALIFDWRIHRIDVETAPRILVNGMWAYDPERLKHVDVRSTAKGEDFVFHIERLSEAPRKTLR